MIEDPLIDAIGVAVERSPDLAELRLHFAQLLVDRAHYVEALSHCGRVLECDPTNTAALQLLQRCTAGLTARVHLDSAKAIPDVERDSHQALALAPRADVGTADGSKGRKQPAQSGRPKLRWRAVGDADPRTGEVLATMADVTYRVQPSKEGWKATVHKDGKTTVLVTDVSRNRAYYAATHYHHWDKMPEPNNVKATGDAERAVLRQETAHDEGAPLPSSASAASTSSSDLVERILDWAASPGFEEALEEIRGAAQRFIAHAEADRLLLDDPFAFLLGVIADYHIRAERAWRFPYELRARLGYLDPHRIAQEPDAVRRAVDTPPKLHRYVANVSAWAVAAARIVCNRYQGEAAGIWNDNPTARELQQRFQEFPGIGPKKAAMAVLILERDRGVPIRDMDGSDIAYDVHVRRVFLRTRLAQFDNKDHMIAVARSAHPHRPGDIDLPAWLIGRNWCRPSFPLCASCPLSAVCPKDIDAGPGHH